ncbi:MAG: DUF47 family protein [Gammaproteobacteria bacterium]|nr:MAG: DUF47 family protein [Gammaproteobacteria bacterium]
MMGFIRRYLLPREIDFNAALEDQAHKARYMVETLHRACVHDDRELLMRISEQAAEARRLKDRNMRELLNVFITPYDKESIYRMIVQLDWIALSVKHFRIEAEVLELHSLADFEPILEILLHMADALARGIEVLKARDAALIAARIEQVEDQYDAVVEHCAQATGRLLGEEDPRRIIRGELIIKQAKDVAMRIRVAANTLEDMSLKIA